jgi:hypothetical protein
MDNSKLRELMDLVYNSIKANIESSNPKWIKPEKTDWFYTLKPEKGVEAVREDNIKFDFTINTTADARDLKYIFEVSIARVKRTKGFWKSIDDSRYITKILIKENSKYTRELETYYLDSDLEVTNGYLSTRDIQSKIFDILMQNHGFKQNQKDNESIDGFITEIKKTVDKSILRDDKINDILD